jgi:RNA polymerase subunit RPABC4/transcription elongation factor Spt4
MKVCRNCLVLLSNEATYCTNCGNDSLEDYREV